MICLTVKSGRCGGVKGKSFIHAESGLRGVECLLTQTFVSNCYNGGGGKLQLNSRSVATNWNWDYFDVKRCYHGIRVAMGGQLFQMSDAHLETWNFWAAVMGFPVQEGLAIRPLEESLTCPLYSLQDPEPPMRVLFS